MNLGKLHYYYTTVPNLLFGTPLLVHFDFLAHLLSNRIQIVLTA